MVLLKHLLEHRHGNPSRYIHIPLTQLREVFSLLLHSFSMSLAFVTFSGFALSKFHC